MRKKKTLKISGMSCISCQNKIEKALKKAKGIENASISYETETAEISFDDEKISLKEIEQIVRDAGYDIGKDESIVRTASILILIFALFLLLQRSGILNTLAPGQLADSTMSYGMLFLIGLLTSVHCIAMCGGINLSQCIGNGGKSFASAFSYNLGRVLSYTGIGFVLGLIGSLAGGDASIGVPVFVQGILKLIAGILMVLMGINMLNLFPGFRKFTPRVPKRFSVAVNKKKAGSSAFVVGLLNGFMPCGPLQSMQIVALASGSPVKGALSMLMFSLGTVPLMLGLGSIVTMIGRKFTRKVMTAGSVLVVVLGLAMLSQGSSLVSPYMLSGGNTGVEVGTAVEGDSNSAVQEIHSTLTSYGYPDITVTAGTPVKWVIDVPKNTLNGCNYKMLLSAYGIEHTFTEGENVIEFTPTKTGDIPYTCWMGMIRGDIFVTDGSESAETIEKQSDAVISNSGCCGSGSSGVSNGCCGGSVRNSCCGA